MRLPKAYNPKDYESDIYALWEKQRAFEPKHRGNEASYSIVMPPPNANGNLHLGHGLTFAIEDILTRYHRLKGQAALLLPGADHAGFETQVVYEKVLATRGKSRFDFSREELYRQIWDFVAKNKDNYESQFRRLGTGADWSRYTYTLDDKITNLAFKTFKKMWDERLVYRGERLVNYCTFHGTSFADIEVAYRETPGHLWHIRYPLVDGSGEVVVATTRPETMLGDTAVAVHPDDKRYGSLAGKSVHLPLTNREIPIIADDFVDTSFGTGAVKITPAHDQNDFEAGQRHDLPRMTVIDFEGKMSHAVPEKYRGLPVDEARRQVVDDLTQQGYLLKTEDHVHNVGHCYKCDTVIQPLLKEQWFINIKPLAEPAIAALKAKHIRFYPAGKGDQLIKYYEGLRDWNISRQIAWGIPIPAFQNVDDPDDWIYDERVEHETLEVNGKTYHRDPDVFDTWFSSSSWPYATLNYPDGADYRQFYPLSVMETASDILYPWVSRMIMFGLYMTGQVPFKDVYLHGLIQDEQGQKMSKSKGNVIDPMSLVDEFGSDAFRMGIIAGEAPGNNRPFDRSKMIGARNFTNKLWNIARFIDDKVGDSPLPKSPQPQTPADHWVLTKLQHATEVVGQNLAEYRFAEAYETIYQFVWSDLADWYIEASKSTPNPGVLQHVLLAVLQMTHPLAPFVTEAIWQALEWAPDELVATSHWPTLPGGEMAAVKQFERIKELVSEIRYLSTSLQSPKPTLFFSGQGIIAQHTELIMQLARLSEVVEVAEGQGMQLLASGGQAWLDIEPSKLKSFVAQLKAQKTEAEASVKQLKSRLSNKGYVANAPATVVQQTKDQLAAAETNMTKIKAELARFGSAAH